MGISRMGRRRACTIALLTLCACGADDRTVPDADTARPAPDAPSALDAADARPDRALLTDPTHSAWFVPAPPLFDALFETSAGDFVIEVHRDWAPHGADRFYNLVRNGYYDEVRLSRIVEGFIAQWGIHGDPAVNVAWAGRFIPDDPVRTSNLRGFVAFAFTDPGTRGTQVFVSAVDNSRLDDQGFAPFGRVIRGMEIVDALHPGYGESSGGGLRAGNQGPLMEDGNEYIDREFPELDFIRRATVASGRAPDGPPTDPGGDA